MTATDIVVVIIAITFCIAVTTAFGIVAYIVYQEWKS